MGYPQGSVVLADDLYKDGIRPYFIISNEDRPFRHDSVTIVVMSTNNQSNSVEVQPDRDIVEGRLNKTSYVKPWALNTLRIDDIIRRVAQVSQDKVSDIIKESERYLTPIDS